MNNLIIVGAGTAGCVLAERLTASGHQRVLLIEAGGKPKSRFVSIPAGFAKLFKSQFDWAFESEPQSNADGRRIFIPRGKMLGGSSNVNAQIHQWCHPADFDGWVAAGAHGWGWTDVAPVFQAQESWMGGTVSSSRGKKGPMVVSPNLNVHPLSKAFVASAQTIGLNSTDDYNSGPFNGVWFCQLAHKDGKRFSAYDAYLKPALRRANLEVLTEAHVTRIIFENRRAVGVAVRRGGVEETYRCSRGVVLAAGAFGSPQLLMLSGVGPADALNRVGIPVVHDTPEVGANLQDHPVACLVFRTLRTDTMKTAESLSNVLKYLVRGRGMLASNGIEAFAFTNTNGGLTEKSKAPDLEIIFAPFEWRNQALEPPAIHAFSIAAAAVAPLSRGSLTLKSANPFTPPTIDFGLLSDPEGMDALIIIAGIRLIRKIAATPPLSLDRDEEVDPGEAIEDERDLRSWINTCLQTVYHPTSTCRMGSDQRAVVDPQLRVLGVEGLWVADASVMPSVPRGHPNAVVAMIANRAAELINRES